MGLVSRGLLSKRLASGLAYMGEKGFATIKAAGYDMSEGDKSVRVYWMVPFFDSFFGHAKKE